MLSMNNYYRFRDHRVLGDKEEKSLFKMYNQTTSKEVKRKIRNHIVAHNMKFVVKVAMSYSKKFPHMALKELVSYGLLGLFVSIDKYEYEKYPIKFISYGVYWIKQSIISSMQDLECPVRFPFHVHMRIQKAVNMNKYTEEVNNALNTMIGGVSLDKKLYHNSNLTMADFLEDPNSSNDPDEKLNKKNLKEKLDKAFEANLNKKEQRVIKAWFEIDSEKQNMETIGQNMSITRESVRVAKDKALRKLSKNKDLKEIFADAFA